MSLPVPREMRRHVQKLREVPRIGFGDGGSNAIIKTVRLE
jgi:hypothetical protein